MRLSFSLSTALAKPLQCPLLLRLSPCFFWAASSFLMAHLTPPLHMSTRDGDWSVFIFLGCHLVGAGIERGSLWTLLPKPCSRHAPGCSTDAVSHPQPRNILYLPVLHLHLFMVMSRVPQRELCDFVPGLPPGSSPPKWACSSGDPGHPHSGWGHPGVDSDPSSSMCLLPPPTFLGWPE